MWPQEGDRTQPYGYGCERWLNAQEGPGAGRAMQGREINWAVQKAEVGEEGRSPRHSGEAEEGDSMSNCWLKLAHGGLQTAPHQQPRFQSPEGPGAWRSSLGVKGAEGIKTPKMFRYLP